jgi:hypothetical protein
MGPVRSQTKEEDAGFMIVSTRILIQVGDEKNIESLPSQPTTLTFGEKVFLVAEAAIMEATERDTKPVLDSKVHGILERLEDANTKVRDIAGAYRNWYAELDRISGTSNWSETSQDMVDTDGGFFWVGMRTRTEVCSIKVHQVVVT